MIKFSCRIQSLNPASAGCSLNLRKVWKKHFLPVLVRTESWVCLKQCWQFVWVGIKSVLAASSWTVTFSLSSSSSSDESRPIKPIKGEGWKNVIMISFLAEVSRDFSKAAIHFQKSASLPAHGPAYFPHHLFLPVHFPHCIYCLCVCFFKLHQLILMGKTGLLSIGLLSVSLFRNTSSANSRVWLCFLLCMFAGLFVYACICLQDWEREVNNTQWLLCVIKCVKENKKLLKVGT